MGTTELLSRSGAVTRQAAVRLPPPATSGHRARTSCGSASRAFSIRPGRNMRIEHAEDRARRSLRVHRPGVGKATRYQRQELVARSPFLRRLARPNWPK
jgi:hypothetical protein